MQYQITAIASGYSEWTVDKDGELDKLISRFEGTDELVKYNVNDENGNTVGEDFEEYEEAQEFLTKLLEV